jgi:adenylate cyclase class 2
VPDSGGAGEAMMAGHHPGTEVEIKIRLALPAVVTVHLDRMGFAVTKPRIFEANTIYDRSDDGLRASGRLLRLREVGDSTVLTFKGPASRGKHKSREELETTLGDARTAALILDRLGFSATFRYEKFRTEYEREGEHGVVTVDETPVGWFLELEGEPEWIDRTAAALGYAEADYVTDSYGSLYLQHCESTGIQPGNMVFSEA